MVSLTLTPTTLTIAGEQLDVGGLMTIDVGARSDEVAIRAADGAVTRVVCQSGAAAAELAALLGVWLDPTLPNPSFVASETGTTDPS